MTCKGDTGRAGKRGSTVQVEGWRERAIAAYTFQYGTRGATPAPQLLEEALELPQERSVLTDGRGY